MITQERHLDKSELVDQMAELQQFVHDAARDGTAAHEVEHGLFRRLLSLGHDLLSKFFSLQGSGDIGQQLRIVQEITSATSHVGVGNRCVVQVG